MHTNSINMCSKKKLKINVQNKFREKVPKKGVCGHFSGTKMSKKLFEKNIRKTCLKMCPNKCLKKCPRKSPKVCPKNV